MQGAILVATCLVRVVAIVFCAIFLAVCVADVATCIALDPTMIFSLSFGELPMFLSLLTFLRLLQKCRLGSTWICIVGHFYMSRR